jgi:hypothetical protein
MSRQSRVAGGAAGQEVLVDGLTLGERSGIVHGGLVTVVVPAR